MKVWLICIVVFTLVVSCAGERESPPASGSGKAGSAKTGNDKIKDGIPKHADPGSGVDKAPGPSKKKERTQLVLLGTGTPMPEPERSGPAVAVVVDGFGYMVDLGVGVVRRMQAAQNMGVLGLDPMNANIAFITHLHSDHTLGLPDFIFTPWVIGRKSPPAIYGPRGLKKMSDHIIAAWGEDIFIRELKAHSSGKGGYQADIHEIVPGVIFQDSRVKVTAFPVAHGKWERAFGFRFDTPDKSIVISGDTTQTDEIVRACNGCDILLHEVFSAMAVSRGPAQWQKYHKSYHTSSVQLAHIANRAKPKLLVLYHQLLFGQTEEGLLAEIEAAYKGKIAYGRDLDVFY